MNEASGQCLAVVVAPSRALRMIDCNTEAAANLQWVLSEPAGGHVAA
jgi:hypothetical protein